MAGWLKLHRKILDSQVFSDPDLLRLWIMLLCRANFKPSFFRGREIGVGQVAFSQRLFCDSLGVSKGKLHRDLNRLKVAGMITIEAGRDFSVASVCNWETYQLTEDDERGTSGALVGRTGGADEPLPKKLTIQESPPPTPSRFQSEGDDWAGVGEELRQLGVSRVDDALATAQARGLTVGDIRALIAEWGRHAGAWGPGALFQRLTGQLAHWPPVAPAYGRQLASIASTRSVDEVRCDNDRRRAANAASDRVADELDAVHGAELDALDAAALRELYARAFGAEADVEWESRRRRGGAITKPQRRELLVAIAAEEAVA
jgi:hypothetical protein